MLKETLYCLWFRICMLRILQSFEWIIPAYWLGPRKIRLKILTRKRTLAVIGFHFYFSECNGQYIKKYIESTRKHYYISNKRIYCSTNIVWYVISDLRAQDFAEFPVENSGLLARGTKDLAEDSDSETDTCRYRLPFLFFGTLHKKYAESTWKHYILHIKHIVQTLYGTRMGFRICTLRILRSFEWKILDCWLPPQDKGYMLLIHGWQRIISKPIQNRSSNNLVDCVWLFVFGVCLGVSLECFQFQTLQFSKHAWFDTCEPQPRTTEDGVSESAPMFVADLCIVHKHALVCLLKNGPPTVLAIGIWDIYFTTDCKTIKLINYIGLLESDKLFRDRFWWCFSCAILFNAHV